MPTYLQVSGHGEIFAGEGYRPFAPIRLRSMEGGLLTAEQVARMLGVPKSWVYEQSRLGHIPTVNLGRYRRYRAEAITQWIEAREAAGRSS
jgi:excisionase family DNA binding protein